jgi:hypothetical protein
MEVTHTPTDGRNITGVVHNLSDNAIGHVAQLLQLAILTGTDIIDHFRAVQFTINANNGQIEVHPGYAENFNQNVERMLAEAGEAVASGIDEEIAKE